MKNTWILPCNTAIFDIITHFSTNHEMIWGATSTTEVGDEVYIYLSMPYGEIRYKCHVAETHLSSIPPVFDFLTYAKRKKNFVRLVLDKTFSSQRFPYSSLITHGLVSVQSQMRISNELICYLESNADTQVEEGSSNE